MDASEVTPDDFGQIMRAHEFFKTEAERWLCGDADEDGKLPPGDEFSRARELTETLAARLVVVAIDLTGDDDAQLIFETLNDRGTPLLKADLIKNWVFSRGVKLGADVDKWSQTIWEDFDTDWWREEITKGRASKSRVDVFLHYWLTMRLREEVKQELVFRTFIDYAEPLMQDIDSAKSFLTELRRDADTYRGIENLEPDTAQGRFRTRVIESMELAATTPVFLWVVSQNHELPPDQIEIGLASIESWVVRRTLMQLTSKDTNKLVVALLKSIHDEPKNSAGVAIRTFLSQQTAGTREWPSDEKFLEVVGSNRMYGNIKQGRIAVVLAAIEEYRRQSKKSNYGAVTLPSGLTIEHIMPQKWREHWKADPPLTPEQEQKRDKLVHTLGNLTLVSQGLNSALSNRPWTDAEAANLKDGGQVGKGKWSLLNQFNLIVLNKDVLDAHLDSWDESDISARANELALAITKIWPGPDVAVQSTAIQETLGEVPKV
jgi:hypothetical protein